MYDKQIEHSLLRFYDIAPIIWKSNTLLKQFFNSYTLHGI